MTLLLHTYLAPIHPSSNLFLGRRVAEFICTISCLLMHQIPHSGLFSDEFSPGKEKRRSHFNVFLAVGFTNYLFT
jgi:hypothetical protein